MKSNTPTARPKSGSRPDASESRKQDIDTPGRAPGNGRPPQSRTYADGEVFTDPGTVVVIGF